MKTLRYLGELLYPYLFGIGAGVFVWFYYQKHPIPEHVYDLLTNGVNLGGIAVGFMGATIALIYSLQDSYVIKRLKELNHFSTFISYFHQALCACLLLTLLGALGFFLDFKASELLQHIYFAVWVCLFITAGFSAYRFVWAFSRILRITAKPQ